MNNKELMKYIFGTECGCYVDISGKCDNCNIINKCECHE